MPASSFCSSSKCLRCSGVNCLRQLHVDRGVEIAMLVRLAGRRHPVALQPEHLRVLRRRRNLEAQRLAAERLHFGLAAEHRRGQRNRHARVEVRALALELRMRRLPDPQIRDRPAARRPSPARPRRRRARASRRRRRPESARRPCAPGRRAGSRSGASRPCTGPRARARAPARCRVRGAAAARLRARPARTSPRLLGRALPPKKVWKKSENGFASPNISRISSSVIVRKPPPWGRRRRS